MHSSLRRVRGTAGTQTDSLGSTAPGLLPLGPAGSPTTANPSSRRPAGAPRRCPCPVAALAPPAEERVPGQRLGNFQDACQPSRGRQRSRLGPSSLGSPAARSGTHARPAARTLCAARPPNGQTRRRTRGGQEPGSRSECPGWSGLLRARRPAGPPAWAPLLGAAETQRTSARSPQARSSEPSPVGTEWGTCVPFPGDGSSPRTRLGCYQRRRASGCLPLPTHLENPLALPEGEKTPSPLPKAPNVHVPRPPDARPALGIRGAEVEAAESRGEP